MTEQINKQLLDKAKLALADWDAPLTVDYPHDLGARMVELGQAIAAAEQTINAGPKLLGYDVQLTAGIWMSLDEAREIFAINPDGPLKVVAIYEVSEK